MIEEELVRYIAENLVSHPEQVRLNRRESGKSIILELHVAPEDMGRIIGKNGRVANSIRALLRALPNQKGGRVILEID